MRRIALIGLALTAVLGSVVACSKPEPAVSFFSHGTTVSTQPSAYCDIQVTKCYATDRSVQTLRVPAGSPLQISVPDDVANAAWVVLFKYTDANGKEQQARSPLFKASTQYAYTLTGPTPSDQITAVQVEIVGAIEMAPTDTAPTYLATTFWSLNATS